MKAGTYRAHAYTNRKTTHANILNKPQEAEKHYLGSRKRAVYNILKKKKNCWLPREQIKEPFKGPSVHDVRSASFCFIYCCIF